MTEVIRTHHLTKYYGDTLAVHDIGLTVGKGEIFGFLGPNGAGKTTTIRMLLGMIAPSSGSCFLLGKRVTPGSTKIWNEVGYMVETPYAYPELTVRENLQIILKLRGLKDQKQIDWILKKLKLEKYAAKKAKHLSLGNAQRLGIAKALLHRPPILILDEPTNGLDPEGIVEIRQLLQDLAGNFGVTILISSHKLDEISRVATKIGIIHNGRMLKEIDSAQLENQLKKRLLLDGRDQEGMSKTLAKAGYHVFQAGIHQGGETSLFAIENQEAINRPDEIASLLVKSGYPPTLLSVQKEDLETFFLRTIQEGGEDGRE